MSCCLPPGRVLTRQERAAIARLRERRAAGLSPSSTAHTAAAPRPDPLVTFYANTATSAAPKPLRKPRPKKPSARRPRQPTAHQLKKEAATLQRANRNSPRIAAPPQKHMREKSMSETEKENKTAIVAFKGALQQLRRPAPSGGSTTSSSEEQRPVPFFGAAKAAAMWQMLKGGREGSDEETARQTEGTTGTGISGSQALKENMRKKWNDVVTRFGGNSAKGERFVLKERPEPSDFAESNNDIYFQKLMTMDS